MPSRLAKHFESFADLATAYQRDVDYRIVALPRESSIMVLAPHGGRIEAYTSEIARAVAGEDFQLYLFEGCLRAGNYAALHLASDRYDEASCLDMLSVSDKVVSVHGCRARGEIVYVGGRDDELRTAITDRLVAIGISCEAPPDGMAGLGANNLCNRDRTGRGVQLEVSLDLRRSTSRAVLARAVREALQG